MIERQKKKKLQNFVKQVLKKKKVRLTEETFRKENAQILYEKFA